MKKVLIFVSLIGLVLSGCIKTITPHAKPETLPIIDAHMHLTGDMSPEELIALMDKAGVKKMVLMARYYRGPDPGYGSDEQALGCAWKYPGRFIPFVAGQRGNLGQAQRKRWLEPDRIAENLLVEAENKLKSGEFYGLGEFIIRHYPYVTRFNHIANDLNIPVDTPLMRRFADLGAKYQVPLLIHAEGEPDVVNGMISLLEYNPKTKIIWAHNCGRSSSAQIRKLLTQYPNLLCDLGGMTNTPHSGYGRGWPQRTKWTYLIEDGNGNLYPEMRTLYEDFPDRFFIGTDVAYREFLERYEASIFRFRELLSDLTLNTARRIAFENAEKLFTK